METSSEKSIITKILVNSFEPRSPNIIKTNGQVLLEEVNQFNLDPQLLTNTQIQIPLYNIASTSFSGIMQDPVTTLSNTSYRPLGRLLLDGHGLGRRMW